MRLLWRCASVLLFVAPLCWHSQYAGCTEPRQEDQRCLHAQDISTEEDPGERGHHHRVGERWVAHVHSVSESQQLKGGDAQVEGQQATHRVDENQLQIEGSQAEEMVAELVVEPESPGAWPGSVPPLELEVGEPLPEASITQDQDSGHYSELPPPPHSAVTPIAAEPEDQPATPSSQNRNLNTVSEDDVPDVTASEHSDVDPASADCESESNPYDDASPPVVLENTSNAHTAGTKTHSSPSLSTQPDHRANTSHMLKDKGLSTPLVTETEPGVGSKDPEDIPTFDEWKRKMMEVEKEKIQTPQTPTNGAAHPAKKVQKNINNYASVECGAKILGANPEAKSTSAILKENMDLYMLNPCSNKIWFIIELCESIQVKQLDIANFELFSSTPKDFVVSISDRYPTNKWLKLGTFHGRDERTVQSFPLDEHLYAKYVKVELVSHFGSEHFCPLSLIRVFGTTMVEEYDLIADPSERTDGQDDDLDNLPGSVPGEVKSSNNLIGSAKDVILNMVNNLAVNVLGGGQGNFSAQDLNATESNAQADASNPSTMPDTEEPETPSTSDTVEARASIPEISFPETPATDSAVPELPPSKDEIVTPLPQDEEEHISSTITLLDKEDDTEERKEKEEQRRQKEGSDYCATSLSSSCSCATSLSEYLHQWCSALLSERRTCQMPKREPTASQRIQTVTPTWLLPLPPSACPQPQPPQAKPHRPKKETQHGHHPTEAAGPLVESSAAQEEAWSKPPPLEPSQIPNLPEPSASKSPPTATPTLSPTPTVEPLQPTELGPDQSWDVQVEEEREEPTAGVLTPSEGPAMEQLPPWDAKQPELDAAIPSPDAGDPLQDGQPPTFPPVEDEEAAPRNASHPTPNNMTADSEPPHGQSAAPEAKAESAGEDVLLSSSGPHPSHPSPTTPHLSSTEFYAELQQEQWNGNPVHGSNQKESVFMRLNNRIKALEMNMSLSGRYLEQLSQRYRKQMEEMQRAFNKTITKLQNTSRMAEEQDLRQTESIQALQDQLKNMTQLVLNLSVRVSQLQREVSDRQSYLLLSLLLFLLLGFLLYFNYQCSSAAPPPALPAPRIPKSYSYCCPESQFTSSGDAGLSRSASYPLLHDADSFHLAGVKDPENLYTEETQEICPDEDKSFLTRKRRCKTKPSAKVEPLAPCPPSALPPPYGAVVCNGGSLAAHPASMLRESLGSTFRDSPSEGSSEASSHSDDTSFCGIATTCSRICTGLPPARTRAEKRALRRQRPRPGEAVAEPLRAPGRSRSGSLPVSTLQDLMRRATEQSSGTFGAKPVLSGRV